MKTRLRILWNNPAVLTLHLSFLVILAGALCTSFFQQRGGVRLSPGEPVSEFWSAEGKLLPLPEIMELDSFRIEYYPGGIAPRDYVSYLKVGGKPCVISMNRILETKGYRFCQADYDYDGSTILSVNYDPLGIALIYTGFIIFAISGAWILISYRCKWLVSARLISRFSFSGNNLFSSITDCILSIAIVISLSCFVYRWILSDHIPLSNTYETLLFVVFILELIILFTCRKDIMFRLIAMIFTGALAIMAYLMGKGLSDSPLMPVLNSPWFPIHVSIVMTAYALFGLTFVAAVTAVISPSKTERMHRLSLAALYPAEWLLGLGIITGAVWANISWGRYWSWDPKETLALVTFLIYALPLHNGIPLFRNSHRFHIYMLFAILSVAATYFGVNLLPSLHAYN